MKIKNLKLKIIFFGSSKFVIPIIEVLQKNFDLALAVTTEKNPTDPIPSYCAINKIPYLSVSSFSDPELNSQLSNVNCQLAMLADFGLFIPNEILNIFPKGIINIHPSLLPKYRGPTPVQTAIINGEKETGVSIMKLDEEIDHGPIFAQEKEEILPQDTAESLYERLFRKGAEMLPGILNKYLDGNLKPVAQNHKNATYTKHLTRQDGFIDISKIKYSPRGEAGQKSKIEIERMMRAYYPWPSAWTKIRIKSQELRIKFLPGEKIQVEGKKPMNYKDFINGYPKVGKEILTKLGLLDNPAEWD
ncbi:MAG: hypothetical protein A3D74_01160 [Candidatus Levybacteria bacterium RIFCSPHIGHO2_02_FULL_37_13]|nr:MAG: hypothetical protein A3D74_01160 [Candidatus Levybacteria bacterium RIFCSPHIGHO2_02_FULL_37_13]OGH39625.1 MAG: hypothetical protein A3B41_01745 [Candidatus Levybacteria bacterium RIFCSPLOWO2_01_FULL_37_26]